MGEGGLTAPLALFPTVVANLTAGWPVTLLAMRVKTRPDQPAHAALGPPIARFRSPPSRVG